MVFRFLILFSLCIFWGCSQKTGTKVSIKNSFALGSNTGGMMLYLRNESGNVRAISLDEPTYEILLDNGNWTFTIVSWDGATPFSGNFVCGRTTSSLTGGDVEVNLGINSTKCDSSNFSPSSYIVGGATNGLRLVNCSTLGGVSGAGSDCDNTAKGISGSYKIRLLEYLTTAPTSLPANPTGIESDCITAIVGVPSITNTNIQFPMGNGAEKFSTVIESYTDASCSAGKNSYFFANGLVSTPNVPSSVLAYPFGAYADIYLLHAGIKITGTSPVGPITPGNTSPQTYTITNYSPSGVASLAGTITGAGVNFVGGFYPGGGSCSLSLGSLSSCTVILNYAPTVAGIFNHTLNIAYNNGVDNLTATYALTTVTTASVTYTSGTPTFGNLPQGGSSVTQTFVFTNNGGVNAVLSPITGISIYTMTANSCGAGTIIPGGNCSVTVTLPTAALGTYNQILTVNYNDGLNPQTAVLPLTGSVVTPALLSISNPGTYQYGYIDVGTNPTFTFTITNSGQATATSLSFSGFTGPYSNTGGTCSSGTLAGGGGTCTVIVQFAPTVYGASSMTLTANYNDGVGAMNATRPIAGNGVMVASVTALYTNAAQWNDYFVHSNSLTWFNDSNTACVAGSSTNCLHGGELRKVSLSSFNSGTCSGITWADSLGVFEWECVSGNPVIFRSVGFKKGKGLKDLLSASAWLNNSFSVDLGANVIARSPLTAWWTNTVINLTGAITSGTFGSVLPLAGAGYTGKNSSGTASPGNLLSWDLDTANAIYTISSNLSVPSIHIGANKIALVTLGGSLLTTANVVTSTCNGTTGNISGANTAALVCAGAAAGKDHTWIEINGVGPATTGYGIFLFGPRYSRIHQSDIHTGFSGVKISTAAKINRITNTTTHDLLENGIILYDSNNQIVRDSVSINNVGVGMYLFWGGTNSILFSRALYNGSHGIEIDESPGNKLHNVMTANNGTAAAGITISGGGSNGNILSHITSTQNKAYGLFLDASIFTDVLNSTFNNNIGSGIKLSASTNNMFVNVVSSNNGTASPGIELVATSSTNTFKNIVAAHNYKNISISSSSSNIFDIVLTGNPGNMDCYWVGGTGNTLNGGAFPASGSCAGTVSNLNIGVGNTYIGLTSTDPNNAHDVALIAGSGIINGGSITDFLSFSNPHRYWGRSDTGAPFDDPMVASARGDCYNAINCSLWDWRLKSGDTNLLNTSGSGASTNATFTPGAACPALLAGSQFLNDGGISFMYHASELVDLHDGLGNDNGLCESNEMCLYSPNFGSFQGEGQLTNTCTFSGSPVTGVQMRAFSQYYGI